MVFPPRKPEKVSETVQQIMVLKYADKDRYIKEKLHARAHHDVSHRWRNRRWAVLIAVNLLFVFSFWLDIQILEGALTASRFVGFHLIDYAVHGWDVAASLGSPFTLPDDVVERTRARYLEAYERLTGHPLELS